MVVVTQTDIDYGLIFGPFPKKLTGTDPAFLIGILTNDKPVQGEMVLKIDPSERRDGLAAVEWLPYVRPARNDDEKNMEAYVKEGQVYYRTLCIIKAGRPLLVWYSEDFCQLLSIPEISKNFDKDKDGYICPRCGEVFEFPFSLRAHVKFRCSMYMSPEERAFLDTIEKSLLAMVRGRPWHHDDARLNGGALAGRLREGLGSNGLLSKSRRPASEVEESPASKKPSLSSRGLGSPGEERGRSPREGEDTPRGDHKLETHSDGMSAFRKVEKMHPVDKEAGKVRARLTQVSSSASTPTSASLVDQSRLAAPPPPMVSVPSSLPMMRDAPGLHGSVGLGMLVPRFPFGPHGGFPPGLAPSRSLYAEQAPSNSSDMFRPPSLGQMQGPLTESFANIRNGDSGSETLAKQMLLAERSNVGYFMKPAAPMVEKLMYSSPPSAAQFSATALTAISMCQNWCAKCNASFRMTSDLVYHMRSHHKREFDPMKRKREDKLKCTICNETFRERHHLTRHMTSHT